MPDDKSHQPSRTPFMSVWEVKDVVNFRRRGYEGRFDGTIVEKNLIDGTIAVHLAGTTSTVLWIYPQFADLQMGRSHKSQKYQKIKPTPSEKREAKYSEALKEMGTSPWVNTPLPSDYERELHTGEGLPPPQDAHFLCRAEPHGKYRWQFSLAAPSVFELLTREQMEAKKKAAKLLGFEVLKLERTPT